MNIISSPFPVVVLTGSLLQQNGLKDEISAVGTGNVFFSVSDPYSLKPDPPKIGVRIRFQVVSQHCLTLINEKIVYLIPVCKTVNKI